MSGTTTRPLWIPTLECCLVLAASTLLVLISLGVGTWPPGATCAPLLFTEEPMIVSQQSLNGACEDSTGAIRNDLEEWTSDTGSCDRIVCHVEPSGNYTITHSCRPREPYENPDSVNCVWESDSNLAYPDCCPVLSCDSASPLSTAAPNVCYDLASSSACEIWFNLTSSCTDTQAYSYQFLTFCNSTCGFC